MVPEVGQRFGPYEILGKLGSGGMGLVFRAWDQRLHREVAIKLLHDDYTMPGMRERFLQEARAASALNHPNICMIFDIGEQDQNPYLVMEMLAGETLKDRIDRGALSTEEIVRYAMEIADALAVAHSKGVVHRDIKPANIFLVSTSSGKKQAKVLDFGLAKIDIEERGGWESRTLDMTIPGSTVGTLAYMSPEQARGESLDSRTDLFSLGIVMYEMATRQVPFQGTNSAMMLAELLRKSPERVTIWNDSIPRDIELIILKLLAKDRKGRFQSAKELHAVLEKISEKLGRGGWLTRVTTPTVPLVRTSDPVARHKSPIRTSGSRGVSLFAEASSSHGRMVSRATRESYSGARRLSRHTTRECAIGVESGPRDFEGHSNHGSAYGAAATVDSERVAMAIPSSHEQQSARQTRGLDAAPSAFHADEVDLQYELEEDSLQELIAESSAVGARVRSRIVIAAAMIVVGVVLAALVHYGLIRPLVLGPNDRLLLTVIENKTGDKTLDGTVMQGLETALRDSSSLNLLGGEAYLAGKRQVASGNSAATPVSEDEVAQKVGARAYLYGEIKGRAAPFTISIDVLKTDSNDKLTTLEETARSREEIPAAIGRIAQDIEVELSEDDKDGLQSTASRKNDATASVDALHAFGEGKAAAQSGHPIEAIAAYQRAVTIDPKFVQAQMELAWLYRAEKAEVSAASAATLARDASGNAGEKIKLLARFCYEVNVSADYAHAAETIRDYATRYPLDPEGSKGLARALNAEGLLPDALIVAEKGYSEHPFDAGMYIEAIQAMIGMNQYESALQLGLQAEREGLVLNGNALVAGYLAGKEDVVGAQKAILQSAASGSQPVSFGALYDYGNFLDNTGETTAAETLWTTAAERAAAIPGLASTQASMLAQEALNHGIAESCPSALALVDEVKKLPMGPAASFHAGLAAGLCGDLPFATRMASTLEQRYPKSEVVIRTYLPLLQAAAEIGVNEPDEALKFLATLKANDSMPIASYLRGMAQSALGNSSAAILDFQNVQVHPGASLLWGGTIYPAAEIQSARTYGEARDKSDSVAAYRRFLALWGDANPSQPLLMEALAKTGPH
jgi:serine/threonine-protein kinase